MLLCLIIFCFFPMKTHAETSLYPFTTARQEAQFNQLLHEFRCLVCQNQDLADSNAPLARDLKLEVYQLVKEGNSDDDIIRFLTTRYGDFILLKPPVKTATLLLWLGPLLFLIAGLWLLKRHCRVRVA